MVTGIADVFYFVQDMGRATAFYRDALGLGEPAYASEHWTSFAVGGVTFALHWTEGAPVGQARDEHGSAAGATVTFGVSDIDAAVSALADAGAQQVGEVSRDPWGSLATFVDPDGNVFKLKQPPG
jgi:predicted enzyme related to lactoylglutathione lyase